MLPEALGLKLEFALEELEMEMSRLSPLFNLAKERSLDHIEVIAAAGALHGLYSGFRHHYASHLDAELTRKKLLGFQDVWHQVQSELKAFLTTKP